MNDHHVTQLVTDGGWVTLVACSCGDVARYGDHGVDLRSAFHKFATHTWPRRRRVWRFGR